ncbi:hypothetical protein GA0070624_6009 [Micromonospora rhizosphaerae]|uniref:Uncharacterized protein n=1 Tax=Micromonospora rhizosphaerae TaxID=568872 RepID=A0A1C6T7N8_9ACTN|nr:hypothetical protein [Micromonospora rhizosphaerae]SCL37840.1 hypothetical protein GA0070624_6009 [Micromonospora rhizosphaerae]
MKRGRIGDVVVGTIGDVAGTVVDPRRGFGQLRSAVSGRAITLGLAGLAAGLLIACVRRRG